MATMTSPRRVRVAVNGFGRIGRLAARMIVDHAPELELVLINEKEGDAETSAYV